MTITLASDRMRVTMEPAFGAPISSLTDLRSGRQWLVEGPYLGQPGDEAGYGAAQAWAWDECFPTIGKGGHPAWGALWDHGAVWGRPWQIAGEPEPGLCTAARNAPDFVFERVLILEGAAMTAQYRVTNRAARPLPYLWNQHALLATAPPDELRLDGMPALVTDGTHRDWPHHPARNLTKVGTLHEGLMQKSCALAPKGAAAEVVAQDGGIRFDWSEDLTAFGLWVDFGSWPQDRPIHQIAVVPATAMVDDLAQAERPGQLRWRLPVVEKGWSVRVPPTDGSVVKGALS
jgi:hypothetical protein